MYGNQGLKSGLIKPRKNANKSLTFTLTRGDTQVYSTTRSSLPVSTPIQSGSEDPGRGGITTSKKCGVDRHGESAAQAPSRGSGGEAPETQKTFQLWMDNGSGKSPHPPYFANWRVKLQT